MSTSYSIRKRVKKERITNHKQFFWYWIASPTSGKDLFIISGKIYKSYKMHGHMFRSGYYIGWEVIHDDPPWKKMYYHTERDMMDEEIIGYEVDFINFPDVDKKDGYKHEMIRTLFQK